MLLSKNKQQIKTTSTGFTIVELLIVIAIIAILALIVVFAFNGVRMRAIDARLKADLSQAGTKLLTLSNTGDVSAFPQNFSDTGLQSSTEEGGTTYVYNVNAQGTVYCLQAINSQRSYYITNGDTNPQTGECDGTTGVPTDGNFTEEIDLSGDETQTVTYNNGSGVGQVFTVDVPAGMDYLNVHTSGGSKTGTFGANLRIRQGAAPTSGTNDCWTASAQGNLEQCYMTAPTAGTWYIEVYPYYATDTYTAVDLVMEWGYDEGEYSSPQTISGGIWNRKYYTVTVPAGTDYLSVSTTGGTDTGYGANVAVRQGAKPGSTGSATTNSTCYSAGNTDNYDNCFIYNPTPGTWHISVFSTWNTAATGTYNNAVFDVAMGEFEGDYTSPLTLSAPYWSRKIYTYTVPAGVDYVKFRTYGGTETGNGANVAVKYNALPGSNTYANNGADCNSEDTENYDACFIYSPTPGTWYASVYSTGTYWGTYTSANFDITTGNFEGAYTGPVSVSGSYFDRKIYTINVAPGTTSLTATLSGGTETGYGANLGLKYNSPPGTGSSTTSGNACNSQGSGNTESCTVNSPTAGTWYISVFTNGTFADDSTFNNVTLNVTTAP